MKQRFLFAISALLFIVSCSKETAFQDQEMTSPPPAYITSSGQPEYANQYYTSNTTGRQQFDFYQRADNTTDKGIVLAIHGGGWVTGPETNSSETIFKIPDWNLISQLNNEGYNCIVMKYRLPVYTTLNSGTSNTGIYYTRIMDDIDSMVNWIQTHNTIGNSFSFNNSKIALLGESAGSHLALMYAYQHYQNSALKTVIAFFPGTDLSQTSTICPKPDNKIHFYLRLPYNPDNPDSPEYTEGNTPNACNDVDMPFNFYALRAFDCMIGNNNSNSSAIAKAARKEKSPVWFFDNANPSRITKTQATKTLLLHGTGDSLITYNQTQLLAKKLGLPTGAFIMEASNTRHRYRLLAGYNHGWAGNSITPVWNEVKSWLANKMQ